MTTETDVLELYNAGRILEAMDMARTAIAERSPGDPDLPKFWVRLAWCHYRRREYDIVRSCLDEAGDVEAALELRAYLAAYVDKEDERLRQIAEHLPGNLNIQNARVIRARDADSTAVSLEELESILVRFVQERGVEAANLFHNGARLYLAKARNQQDLGHAEVVIDGALERYGTEAHWHHRGAANFWKSQILERLGEQEGARAAKVESARLWERAVELDPTNTAFQQNLENARRRASEL